MDLPFRYIDFVTTHFWCTSYSCYQIRVARQIWKLTTVAVAKLQAEGMHPDGGGLYLQVSSSGAKSWIYRFVLDGRRHEMGLGSLSIVDLKTARARATDARRLVYDGVDPIADRRRKREQVRAERRSAITFAQAEEGYFATYGALWKNPKQREYWRRVMRNEVLPILGPMSIQSIDTAAVLRVLEPIWPTRTDLASRVRERIAQVLDWATAKEMRTGTNPARWNGHLDKLLPPPRKLRPVVHHVALQYRKVPEFVAQLAVRRGTAAVALHFLILTAVRSGEARGARWSEIDMERALWTIPAERMKSARPHRVPLSPPALKILLSQRAAADGDFVFPGQAKHALAAETFRVLLRRMGHDEITSHGFRSSFRDWVAEETGHANEAAEMALAHAVPNSVEAAYRRGDMFAKRQQLMADWGAYCESAPPASPTAVRRRGKAAPKNATGQLDRKEDRRA